MNQPGIRKYNVASCGRFLGYDGEDLTEWIEQFERAALANRWGDVRKTHMAASLLDGLAVQWYNSVKAIIVA